MAGPTYYDAVVNIALNEDWAVPFVYSWLASDGVTTTPIDLTGSLLKCEIRMQEADPEAIVSVTSNDNIQITSAGGGEFTIALPRTLTWRLAPGTYFIDFVRLMPGGYQERIWEGSATVVKGTTR